MATARDQATIAVGDSLDTMRAKNDAILYGERTMILALGSDWYKSLPFGELLAGNDRDRNGTASMSESTLIEAMRYARANPHGFRAFVEAARREDNAS